MPEKIHFWRAGVKRFTKFYTKISVGRGDEQKRDQKIFSVRRADEKFSSDENEKKFVRTSLDEDFSGTGTTN